MISLEASSSVQLLKDEEYENQLKSLCYIITLGERKKIQAFENRTSENQAWMDLDNLNFF